MGRRLQTVKLDARLADRIGSLPVLVHEASRGFVVAVSGNLHGDELMACSRSTGWTRCSEACFGRVPSRCTRR